MLVTLSRGVFSLTTLAAAALLSLPAQAQTCFGGDNLDGPCCDAAQLDIPTFLPSFDIASLGICWDDCSPTTNNTRVAWGGLTQVACGQYSAFTDVCTPTGVPFMSGTARLDYTRTWEEVHPVTGERWQVWRFVAKVNLFNAGAAVLCPKPPCLDLFQQAFFYGYVDWAQNCSTGVFRQAAMLFHNCDLFIHNAISAQPLPSHPTTTYGVVAPHSGANPFIPSTTVPVPGGVLSAEAMRNVNSPFGPTLCVKEERIDTGNLIPLAYGCLCGGSSTLQQSANFLNAVGTCGSVLESLFIPSAFPTVPWIYNVSTSLGSWAGTSTYPGPETVLADEGLFRYQDGCSGELSIEVFYGATTAGGWDVGTPGLTKNFVDMASNYTQPISSGPSLPIVGEPLPTEHLIYVNAP